MSLVSCLDSRVPVSLLAVLLLFAGQARPDGAHIALHAVSGAYNITLFTAPDPLVSGPLDLSVLVEDAAADEVLGEAEASGTLARAGSQPVQFVLDHAAASNKLLLAANVNLPSPGSYTLVLRVGRPGAVPATVTTVLTVGQDHRRRTALLFALGLPLAGIVLFLVNQQAKQKARRQRAALH